MLDLGVGRRRAAASAVAARVGMTRARGGGAGARSISGWCARFIEAEAPRVACPGRGVVVAPVPWARHGAWQTRSELKGLRRAYGRGEIPTNPAVGLELPSGEVRPRDDDLEPEDGTDVCRARVIRMTLDRYGKLMPGNEDAEIAPISASLEAR